MIVGLGEVRSEIKSLYQQVYEGLVHNSQLSQHQRQQRMWQLGVVVSAAGGRYRDLRERVCFARRKMWCATPHGRSMCGNPRVASSGELASIDETPGVSCARPH